MLFLVCCQVFALAGEKVRILRDEFGVPHIFASTAAGAAFGAGYAQAEDRLEELLRNYRKAEGSMSDAFGAADWAQHDYRQKLWGHRRESEQHYHELPAHIRAIIEAYQAGVKQYMREHPAEVPKWAPPLEPWQVIALGRYMIWGWIQGDVGGDMRRAGIEPGPIPYLSSNQWLLAPSRTAMHAVIAVVDPHVPWYGEFRWYEERLYADGVAMSGAAVLGMPIPVLGHSQYASVAMTTGGPDTGDVFEEEVSGGRYKFKGEWRPLEVRKDKVGGKEIKLESTHHGPIVAHKNGKAYAAAVPYADQVRMFEQGWAMMTAKNLTEMKAALAMRQLMGQNVMVGTVDGDIYYVRNGRVPIRPKGCDPSRPMPGATGACEWQGIHPFEDLVQIANPPQGYMQNCNISPEWLMKGSPLTPDKYAERFYLYNMPAGPPHQRAAMVLDLLDRAKSVTVEQAISIALSTQVYKAELWQQRIRKAVTQPDEFVKLILDWNRQSDADSRGALAFYLFKRALKDASHAVEPPASLSDDSIAAALVIASAQLPPGATFGTLFRVGRQGAGRTYPAGGGSLGNAGMATPRSINFAQSGKEMVGQSGQSTTQVVILTKPPQSFMAIPLGESDHPESGHFDDQAEKLFSKSRLKPTYFLNPAELKKHVTRTEELVF